MGGADSAGGDGTGTFLGCTVGMVLLDKSQRWKKFEYRDIETVRFLL